ncbi:UDP-N-acetylglucosamine--N-acetylmuramyl-(pentapeptide) pyrophosphoryl-undecaprenol N-acetylglucosamine transferase [Methanopyrus sp.]
MHVLIASGDGGHLTRALALAEELSDRGHDVTFAVNEDSDQAVERLEKAGFEEYVGLPRPRRMGDTVWKAALGGLRNYLAASSALRDVRPDLILSTGAGVAIGPMLAGKFKRLPVAHYEPTDVVSISGKVAKLCADLIGVWDEDMAEYYGDRAVNVGIVLPRSFEEADPEEVRERYGLEDRTLVWTTGSAGYKPALEGLVKCAEKGLLEDWEVAVNTGNAMDPERLKRALSGLCSGVVVKRFFHDFPGLLKAADLVVCLGGATPVEAAALGKPVVVLPRRDVLRDHQYVTAKKLEKRGVAVAAEDASDPDEVVKAVSRALSMDPEDLERMGRKGRELFGGNARERFVDLCEELVASG